MECALRRTYGEEERERERESNTKKSAGGSLCYIVSTRAKNIFIYMYVYKRGRLATS